MDTSGEIEGSDIYETILISNWENYIPSIKEKYRRRIERFHSIMNSDEQVIALFMGLINEVNLFKDIFKRKYNKENIFYVVLSEEIISDEENTRLLQEEHISLCDPEEIIIDEHNNMYVNQLEQAKLWLGAINKIHLKI